MAFATSEREGCIGHLIVVADQYRKPRAVEPGLEQQSAPNLRVGAIETERDTETGHHVPQLEHARISRPGDNPEHFECGPLFAYPRGQVFSHRGEHHLFVGPRPDDVVIGSAEGHGLYRGAGRGVVAIDQEHPFRAGMQVVNEGEKLLGVVLGEHQGHRRLGGGEVLQRG